MNFTPAAHQLSATIHADHSVTVKAGGHSAGTSEAIATATLTPEFREYDDICDVLPWELVVTTESGERVFLNNPRELHILVHGYSAHSLLRGCLTVAARLSALHEQLAREQSGDVAPEVSEPGGLAAGVT
jgi:hypothetical protein